MSLVNTLPTPTLAWSFDGTTTDYITGLTGTTTGSVSYNPTGKYGQSLIMDGSSYVKYTKTLGYNLGTGGATFAMWFKLLAVPVGTNFWIFGASGTSYSDRIYILVGINGLIGWTFIDNTLAGKVLNSPSALVVGVWTHLTFTLFNGTMTMYINGSQVATRSDAPMTGVVLDTQFTIAALAGGSGNNINAEYDDFRIYNTALSATQVQSIYNQQGMPGRGVQVKTAPAYTVSDQSPSPLTLSTYGSATSNTNSPFGGTEGSIENLNYGIPSSVSKTNFSFWGSNCFIEFWMYLSGTNSGNPRIIERGNFPNSEYSVYMNASSGGYYLKFSYGPNYPFAFQFIPGTWNHFSFSYNYATQTLYGSINGSVASGGTTAGITYSSGSSVNLYPSGGGYVIDISNLRVVTGAATLPYISNFTVPTTPLSNYPSGTTALLLRAVSPGITLTGTPLFSQLSQSATSSAVGAFSLRAVNGTSVRAVQVRPQGQFPLNYFTSSLVQTGAGNSWSQNIQGYSGILNNSGTYIASCSTYVGGYEPWRTFSQGNGDWASSGPLYSTSSPYGYTGSVTSGGYSGEWIQIQFPVSVNLTSYAVRNSGNPGLYINNSPSTWYILGSTDQSSWTLLDSRTSIAWSTYSQSQTFYTTPSSSSYTYFRFVTKNILGGAGYNLVEIQQWILYFNTTSTVAAFPVTGFTSAVTSPGGNQYNQTLPGYSFGGSGVYTSNCSSWPAFDGNQPRPWKAFDNDTTTFWENDYGVGGGYTGIGTGNSNTYSGSFTTTVSGSSIGGEWLQLGLPTAIVLYSYSMYARAGFSYRMPYQFIIAGSNDGTTWTTVDSRTGINTWSGQTPVTFTTTTTTAWSFFRLIVQAIKGNGSSTQDVNIGQWSLFGTPSSYTTDFYADRLGNLLTAPVTGQSLANWLGGATGYVTTWYDQSGAGNHMAQVTAANQPVIQKATKGAGYSALFNGTTTQLVSTLSGSLDSTNYTICSVSRRQAAGEMYYIGTNGPSSTRQQLSAGYYTDTTTILNEYAYALVGVTIPGYSSGAEPTGYDYSVFSQTNGMYIYNWRSGTSYASGNSVLTLPMTSSGNILLGYAPWNGANKYFSGEIFELTIFKTSLFDLSGSTPGTYTTPPSIIQSIYQNQLSYTGA